MVGNTGPSPVAMNCSPGLEDEWLSLVADIRRGYQDLAAEELGAKKLKQKAKDDKKKERKAKATAAPKAKPKKKKCKTKKRVRTKDQETAKTQRQRQRKRQEEKTEKEKEKPGQEEERMKAFRLKGNMQKARDKADRAFAGYSSSLTQWQ